MRVKIENLGAIKKADLEMKPLTVFIGPSGTGKTWAAYAISSVVGAYGLRRHLQLPKINLILESYSSLNSAIKQCLTEGSTKFNIVQFTDDYIENYFNNVSEEAKGWLPKYFGTQRTLFDNTSVKTLLSADKPKLLDNILKSSIDATAGSRSENEALIRVVKVSDEAIVYFITEGDVLEKIPGNIVREFITRVVLQTICRSLYHNIFTFITERSTFISMNLGKSSTDLDVTSLEETTVQNSRMVGNTPLPLGNFLNLTRRLYDMPQTTIENRTDNEKTLCYLHLASLLEAQILKGTVQFSTPNPDPLRTLVFEFTDSALEIQSTSSMVKELAVLVLYLRYLAEPNDLIIIDEPEMNLHPEAQAKMAEFIAILVNSNLNVWVTTHSPYIVDHLVNLMKAAKNQSQAAIVDRLYLKNSDALISQDKVAVYFFDNGTATNILDERGIIDWETFSKVSDQINELFFSI